MTCVVLAVYLALVCLQEPGLPQAKPDDPDTSLQKLAGDYGSSDGFVRESLSVTTEGRYFSATDGCLGAMDRSAGCATVVEGRMVLTPDRLNLVRIRFYLQELATVLNYWTIEAANAGTSGERFDLSQKLREIAKELPELLAHLRSDCQPIEFVPVQWDTRVYLVRSEEGKSFCNGANLGLNPAMSFLVRADGGNQERAKGLPLVPDAWRPMLLETPIHGKIIEIMSRGQARVDLGLENGVWEGMSLESDPGGFGGSEVVEVGATSCVIRRYYRTQTAFKNGENVSSKRPGID
ncbi:hypothetical protein V5E97_20020 [Singulisphaera sp. Ch08]|uniref:Uncharacterized protein n=1 Tax=Singulisphaera sp. Ch08 TaxID=3120278 RepID=A0AAU7CRK5_9BACT